MEYFKIIWYIYQLKNIKYFSVTTWSDFWKSKGISEENIENITKSNSNFTPNFCWLSLMTRHNF